LEAEGGYGGGVAFAGEDLGVVVVYFEEADVGVASCC